jgi:hypothetical protein
LGHFGIFFAVSAIMLAVGIAVFAQNPRARPNRNFLLYMTLPSFPAHGRRGCR